MDKAEEGNAATAAVRSRQRKEKEKEQGRRRRAKLASLFLAVNDVFRQSGLARRNVAKQSVTAESARETRAVRADRRLRANQFAAIVCPY
jgi:predicted RNase H-like nuclease